MRRAPQLRRPVNSDDPLADYYNDLRVVALAHVSPEGASRALESMVADRTLANPVSIAQLGLGALQLVDADSNWAGVARSCARWLRDEMDADGNVEYHFTIGHTYNLPAPWVSAMAQGQVASLILRVARLGDGETDAEAGARAVEPLLQGARGLGAATPEGIVLQEYPTTPPAHVLNGWIFALWGLNDVSVADGVSDAVRARARDAFTAGALTLARRLPLYSVLGNWSRYDLYPHPIVHVASPFYHRLHVEQLAVMSVIAPSATIDDYVERWARGDSNPVSLASAVLRKGLFRVIRPRRGPAVKAGS